MGRFWLRLFLLVTMQLTTLATIAQEYGEAISAGNLHRLRSDEHIDFADIDAELEIGWFAANDSATEFVVFRQSGETYSISASGVSRQWSTNWERGDQLFALIDAVYLQDEPMVLHLLDEQYFINQNPLTTGYVPVALFHGFAADDLFVEAIAADGQTRFLHFRREGETGDLRLQDVIPYPSRANDEPVMRIGRIDFPVVVMSSLADNILDFRLYPDFFSEQNARQFPLENGPAVFGAVNWPAASHLAWSDPFRDQLNLLDQVTGENRIVAALGGAYPQTLLLSQDASAILAVNLDFESVIVAWNAESGERFDLGPYRECQRIPDKVELSRDGRALIIGCDTGLDIWRVDGE